jgi:hypothetical protein
MPLVLMKIQRLRKQSMAMIDKNSTTLAMAVTSHHYDDDEKQRGRCVYMFCFVLLFVL